MGGYGSLSSTTATASSSRESRAGLDIVPVLQHRTSDLTAQNKTRNCNALEAVDSVADRQGVTIVELHGMDINADGLYNTWM
jgi:hypothetical protein